MADDKKDKAPSFSKLLRGSATYSESGKGSKIVESTAAEEKSSRRRPIFLPFARKEGEQVLFALSYKEWAFLLGAMLLLFGGMGIIRMLGPKEPAVPDWAQVAELPPAEEGSRPPAGGEGAEDVVTQLQARDTTRLVAPPSGMGTSDDKKDEGKKGPLSDVFREGLRQAEKESPPRPRLPGMLGALSAALGGLSGGSSARDRGAMSPEEIDARLKGISNKQSRGEKGMNLGYSGAQKVPGLTVGKRSREQSDSDAFGKSRQATQEDMNKKFGGAEKAASEAGKAFGESSRGSSEAQGASTGGDTPRQDGGGKDNVNYSIQRPPYSPWAKEEWETNRPWADVLNHSLKKDVAPTLLKDGFAAPIAKVIGSYIGALGYEPPAPPKIVERQFVRSEPALSWVKRVCPRALTAGSDNLKITQALLQEGPDTQARPDPSDPNVVLNTVYVITKGTKISASKGGEKDTKTEEDYTSNPVACTNMGKADASEGDRYWDARSAKYPPDGIVRMDFRHVKVYDINKKPPESSGAPVLAKNEPAAMDTDANRRREVKDILDRQGGDGDTTPSAPWEGGGSDTPVGPDPTVSEDETPSPP